MTFREFMVLLCLYRAAPPDLRRWADQQLPDLKEAAELTEERRVDHVVTGPVQDRIKFDSYLLSCSCGWKWIGSGTEVEKAMREHAGG